MSVSMPISSQSPRVSLPMATLVCGVLSFFLGALSAIPGIVIGHMARSKIKDNPYRFGGDKLALTGLALCYLAGILSLLTLAYIMLHPELLHAIAEYTGYCLLLSE